MLGTANKLKTARQIALTGAVSGSTNFDGSGNVSISTSLQSQALTNQDLNNYKTEGFYYAAGGNTCANKPSGVNNFGLIIKRTAEGNHEQIMDVNDVRYTRFWNGTTWSSWVKTITNGDFAVLDANYNFSVKNNGGDNYSGGLNDLQFTYPTGFNKNNCVAISVSYNIESSTQYSSISSLVNRWFYGNYPNIQFERLEIALLESKIIPYFEAVNMNKEYTVTGHIKIVLMKITNPEVTLLGDANCDGVVNSVDATLIQNYIQGNSSLSLQGFVNADVTKDGDVKASDYQKIKDYIDGKIESL